jgi:nucleotide-binding universal stress UspA family protein
MFKPKKILVPTDFSEYSDKALQKALDIAQQSGAEINLLHVITQEIRQCMSDYCFPIEEFQQFVDKMRATAQEDLAKELEKFPVAKEMKITTELREGVPYDQILQFQTEKGSDLIVIASHGRSGITKYLMGSVASHVAKGAKCEVLLVK